MMKRVTIVGASFDYNWDKIFGMENLVARGEFAYYNNDMSFGAFFADWNPTHRVDHFNYVLGLDKYLFGDWWCSVQLFQEISICAC